MLSKARREVWKLRISLDAKYPGIIGRAETSIVDVRGKPAGRAQRVGCIEVYSNWKHWICCFPQHGSGPKHRRPIALTPWQLLLVNDYPEAFLRGLVHSDGCRCMNRVNGTAYPRYMFANESGDIRSLFMMACGLVGVGARKAGMRNVSVARRADVALLDTFIGPKS